MMSEQVEGQKQHKPAEHGKNGKQCGNDHDLRCEGRLPTITGAEGVCRGSTGAAKNHHQRGKNDPAESQQHCHKEGITTHFSRATPAAYRFSVRLLVSLKELPRAIRHSGDAIEQTLDSVVSRKVGNTTRSALQARPSSVPIKKGEVIMFFIVFIGESVSP